jgi:EAL and modified HD-GYP domain-containing signal transduction protein
VLEVDAALASDADAVAVLRGLAFKGYAIAVRAAREVATIEPLLEFAGIVGLDAGELGDAELGALAEALRERPVTLLARGLDTHEAFARCRELGFHRFQGAFYERPRAVPGARVPGDRLGGLGTLARLVGRDVGFERLEQIVTGDLGLGYKLLRYVNSAFFGLAREVHTVGEALVILGEREVKRWAMVMALAAGPGVPRELTVLSLSRGRMCESFGSGDERLVPEELFTVGMFSVVDVLLDMPLAEILDALPFAPRIEAALLRHEGPLGETLARVLAWERGEFAQAAGGDQPADLAAGYREALEWAERAGRALA